ncbi:hypothetical protein ACRJ4W_29855 [Streptomyces sp. GLT-R25]
MTKPHGAQDQDGAQDRPAEVRQHVEAAHRHVESVARGRQGDGGLLPAALLQMRVRPPRVVLGQPREPHRGQCAQRLVGLVEQPLEPGDADGEPPCLRAGLPAPDAGGLGQPGQVQQPGVDGGVPGERRSYGTPAQQGVPQG